MEQERLTSDTKKQRSKQTDEKEKDGVPVQVDTHSGPLTNFIKNLKRQWKKTQGIGLWKLLRDKISPPAPPNQNAERIIGPTRTIIRSRSTEDTTNGNINQKDNSIKQATTLKVKNDLEVKYGKPNRKGLKL